MSKFLIPNTTQVPNVLLDVVMPQIQNTSLRVLLAVVRFTYGFQKQADKISLTQLQRATGLSRQGVVTGIAALGPLLNVRLGAKGKGPNEYSLNLDIATGQLVNHFDQSTNLTSQKRGARVVNGVDSSKPIVSKPKESVRGKPSLAKGHPKDNGIDGRVKSFIDFYHDEYLKRFEEKYSFTGKDAALLKRLLGTYKLERLQELAVQFLDSTDQWVKTNGGFTIGVFSSQINKLVSTSKVRRAAEPKEMPP